MTEYTDMKKKPDKISTQFRNINILIFLATSSLIGIAMFFLFRNITDTVSQDYARLYSANTVGTLNTYFEGELALIKKAARSKAIINWYEDEYNQEKKLAAYEEMMGIIDVLSSGNLYLGIEETRDEFTVEKGFSIDDIVSSTVYDPDNYMDAWYFNCISSDQDYLLNVDIDKILHRKRIWLNYKVENDNAVLGVISTGLELSKLVNAIFSEYDNKSVRGLVIDENGIIHMDSALSGDGDFLYYTVNNEYHIEDAFPDPTFLNAVDEYLKNIDGYFSSNNVTSVIKVSDGQYHYATIAPIISTTWSVITFYDGSSLYGITKLLPLLIVMLAALIIFVIAINFTSSRLIFIPFEKLMNSIIHAKLNMNKTIYGTDRHDEIGDLSNTVQNMKESLIDALNKVHYDALTGIYNRRFLEENLPRIIQSSSRSLGVLSVMMIDIDFFKKYNDTYGHNMGDTCLKTIASALAGSITRADDFVVRYGGEEFIVVLPNTDESGARLMADRLLENVRACDIPHDASDAASFVTVSIGVATSNVQHTSSNEDLIKRADEALYISKQSGRNKYTFLKFEKTQ